MDAALQNKAAALGWTQPEIDAINSRVKLDKIGPVGPYPAAWMLTKMEETTTQPGKTVEKRVARVVQFLFFWCQCFFSVLGG